MPPVLPTEKTVHIMTLGVDVFGVPRPVNSAHVELG